MPFCEKLESVQYEAALAIIGTVQGTSGNKIYEELGIESLKSRRWYRRLSCMFEIIKEEAQNYLINLIPKCNQTIRTRNSHIYQSSIVKQIVSSILFSLCLKRLV